MLPRAAGFLLPDASSGRRFCTCCHEVLGSNWSPHTRARDMLRWMWGYLGQPSIHTVSKEDPDTCM
jgi:hypothetical protein